LWTKHAFPALYGVHLLSKTVLAAGNVVHIHVSLIRRNVVNWRTCGVAALRLQHCNVL
jgi:hypothetical protein